MEATNDQLFAIQEKLVNPKADILGQTKYLVKWALGNHFRKAFLLELIKKLKREQVFKIPQLLVLQKSIKKDKDYSKQPILPLIKQNCTKNELELAEFILDDKQGSLSKENYEIMLSIKRDIPLPEGTDYYKDITFGFRLYIFQWIDSFGSFECMKVMPPGYITKLVFNAISKEQYLEAFSGVKLAYITRQTWAYDVNPDLFGDSLLGINEKMILLPSSIAIKYKDYAPDFIFTFVRADLFGIPEDDGFWSLMELEDSLANSNFKSLNDFFKQKPSDKIILKLIAAANELLKCMPKLFPILSDFIIQLRPWLSDENLHNLMANGFFLYTVLLDKGLAPKPKEGDPLIYYEYKGKHFHPYSFTSVFLPRDYVFTNQDYCPELKDPRFLFGFGFTMLNDALEEFIPLADGTKNVKYQSPWLDITLKGMASSFGSERIWFWLELNGFPEGKGIERRVFAGRNLALIKHVLKNTTKKLVDLIKDAITVFNFDVFSYLIESNKIKTLKFKQIPSPRFITKVRTPLFFSYNLVHDEIDVITLYFANSGLLSL